MIRIFGLIIVRESELLVNIRAAISHLQNECALKDRVIMILKEELRKP